MVAAAAYCWLVDAYMQSGAASPLYVLFCSGHLGVRLCHGTPAWCARVLALFILVMYRAIGRRCVERTHQAGGCLPTNEGEGIPFLRFLDMLYAFRAFQCLMCFSSQCSAFHCHTLACRRPRNTGGNERESDRRMEDTETAPTARNTPCQSRAFAPRCPSLFSSLELASLRSTVALVLGVSE